MTPIRPDPRGPSLVQHGRASGEWRLVGVATLSPQLAVDLLGVDLEWDSGPWSAVVTTSPVIAILSDDGRTVRTQGGTYQIEGHEPIDWPPSIPREST